MRHDDDVLTAFQFHDDGFETDDHISVGLPAAVAVIVLIVIAGFEVFGVAVRYFLVGKAIADARVKLVEGLPFKFGVAGLGGCEEACSLDGAFQGGSPDCQLPVVADRRGNKFGEGTSVEFTSL